jgi:hypothetical protein
VRSSAAPVLLGLRWMRRRLTEPDGSWPRARIAPGRSLRLASKVALDELFFTTELASSAFVSLRDRSRLTREIHEGVDLFDRRGWLEDPRRFHVDPPALEEVEVTPRRSPWGRFSVLSFESGYAPHAGEPGRDRWLAHESNRTARAWLMEHPGPARPWLVCVPGYRMGHPAVDFTGFRAGWLHRRLGLNVAIPVMPLHGPRRSGRRGGDGFFSGDFVDTLHGQAQAIWDIRRLVGWLRRDGTPGVGVHGVSLGAHTAALLAGLDPDLACVIAGIPAADFTQLARQHVPELLVRVAERFQFPFSKIEQLLKVVSPLALSPLVARERCFLYAGIADQLASPDHARALWNHWRRPRLAWYEGSHVSFVWESKVKSLVHEALQTSGLLEDARA